MSLVAQVLPTAKRTMGVALHSLVRRVPMALGPVIGGLFIDHWGDKTASAWRSSPPWPWPASPSSCSRSLIPDDRASRGRGQAHSRGTRSKSCARCTRP